MSSGINMVPDLEKSNPGRVTPSLDEKKSDSGAEVHVGPVKGAQLGTSGIIPKENVRVALQQRHLQMIALAGTIGTGLFLGSGSALSTAGPVGVLLAYLLIASIVVGTVLALAEMASLVPISGSYLRHAALWFDDAVSFAAGWNSVYNNLVSVPTEIVACTVLFQFWTDVNSSVWIVILTALVILANGLFVRIYGELEFCFSMLKIALVVGLIIFGICIDLGAGPHGERIGFRYWKDPGPFSPYIVSGSTGKFVGFWVALGNAAFSFSSAETVAMAAAETKNPRRNIPIAAKKIFIRVFLFYILAIFVVGLIVPSDDQELLNDSGNASASPFVVAANRAGVKVLPHIVNAVVLTSAWSAANSFTFITSRSLYGMALDGTAPKIFAKTHKWGVPYVGVGLILLFSPLAFLCLSSSSTKAFSWLQSLISSITLITWCTILAIYLRFYKGMKVQGIDRNELPYKAPFQPYLSIFAFCFCMLVLLTGGFTTFMKHNWDTQTFFSAYFSIPLYLGALIGYKVIRKTKMVPYEEMRIREFIAFAKENPEPPSNRKTGPLGWLTGALWG